MRIDIKGDIIPNDDKLIYEWLEMDGTCPKDVLKSIEEAKGDRLDVYINSGGGDISAGSEIYAALQEYTGQVMIHVVGYACSAASVIACAGHSDMVRTGLFMYHNVSGGFRGDHNAMTKGAEILQVADRAIAAAYRAKTGKTEKELLNAMEAETWMTAEDAVSMGFIDEIAESKNLKLSASVFGSLPSGAVEKVRNLIKAPHLDDAEALKIKYKFLNMKMEEMQ